LSSYGDSVCCSCWSNALAAQISGAHPVWFPSVKVSG
jgi:hypothetical protein